MKTKWFDQLHGLTNNEWSRPWELSADQDPADDGTGGGGDASSTDSEIDEEALGEAGRKALSTERAQRKALERQMANLTAQLETVKDLSPEAYRAAQQRAAELEQRLAEREQLTKADRTRIETKAQEAIRKANETATAERQLRINLQIKTAARSVFDAAGGRLEADEAGNTFFDAFMQAHGAKHFRIDESTGNLFVVDADGDRLKTADGQDVKPLDWLNSQADNSPVIGSFFRAKGGEGSGGLSGLRGVRGQQQLSAETARKLQPGTLLASHYQSNR